MKLKKFLAAASRILELQPDAEVFEDKGQITFGLLLYGRDKPSPFAKEIQAELRVLGMKPDCCGHWGFDLGEPDEEDEEQSEADLEPFDYCRRDPCDTCGGKGRILSPGAPGQIFGDGDAWRSCDACEGTGEKDGKV